MGPEDKIEFTESLTADKGFIPGLDVDPNSTISADSKDSKKVPYSKPIPRNFQAHWNDTGKMDDEEPQPRDNDNNFSRAPPVEPPIAVPQTPPQIVQTVCGILVYDKFIPVVPGSKLAQAVGQGTNALNKYISSGDIEEIKDLIPKEETKSPPVKKSRFEPIVDHKAVIIYNDTAESKQYQNADLSPNSTNTNIPSLLGLKVSNPENSQVKAERDWNGARFNENDRNNSNNNNSSSNNNNNNNINNARPNGRNSRFSDNSRSGSAGGGGGGEARRRRRRH